MQQNPTFHTLPSEQYIKFGIKVQMHNLLHLTLSNIFRRGQYRFRTLAQCLTGVAFNFTRLYP